MSGSNRAPGRVGALVVSASLVTGLLVSAVVRSERVSLATSAPAGPQAAAGVSPRQCEGCHLEVAAEWRESLHAQAFRDRVFHAEFAPHPAEECVACHAPLATDLVAPAQADTDQGVTCTSCHQLHPAKEPMVAIPEKSRIKLCVDCHSKQHEAVKAAKANTTSGKEAQ